MRNFGRFLEQIDVLELYELKETDLSVYEILFTSYPAETLNFVPKTLTVFHLDLFFDENTKRTIRSLFVNGTHHSNFKIRSDLRPQQIFTGIEASNEEACFKMIGEALSPLTDSPQQLQEDLLACEQIMASQPAGQRRYPERPAFAYAGRDDCRLCPETSYSLEPQPAKSAGCRVLGSRQHCQGCRTL